MKLNLAAFALISVLWAFPASALDLQQARRDGLVGEKTDGYVGVVKSSAEAKALAEDVNAKRKAEYARISKENGQPVDVVAKLASGQIIQNLEAGSLFQAADGNWKKK